MAWKTIPSYPNYEASELGQIRHKQTLKPLAIIQKKYPQTSLYRDGRAHSVFIHVLVAEAFLGPRPTGLQVNHIDGNKQNNHASNLEYVTASENMRHAYRHALVIRPRGENSPTAKLNNEQVRQIVGLRRTLTQRQIADQFGVSVPLIQKIHSGEMWSEVTRELLPTRSPKTKKLRSAYLGKAQQPTETRNTP